MAGVPFPDGVELPLLPASSYAGNEALPKDVIIEIAGGGGQVQLQQDWTPEYDIYPVVDAVDGPITADGGIESGDLSVTTGLTFYDWNDVDGFNGQPHFNYQGMVPAPAPAGIQSSAGRDCLLNANTPRWFNGNTGQYYNGNQDIRFSASTTRVVVLWYTGQGQMGATKLDMHMLVEHDSANKHLSSSSSVADGMPRTLPATVSSGLYRRDLTFLKRQWREFRILLGPNCYFIGVWIDTKGSIRRPKNKTQLFIHGGDSWNDALTWGSSEGYSWDGDYQCLPQNVIASFRTGMCHGTDGQGGTGEADANGTSGGGLETYAGNRSSAAWSDSRVNWRRDWLSQQYPIFLDIGGWNDGTEIVSDLGTPYRDTYRARVAARIQKTIDRIGALSRATRFIIVGIQPVDISGTSDPKYLAAQGQSDIPALFPGFVLGHVPLMPMWVDTSTSGPRDVFCWESDNIHLKWVGDDNVVGFYLDKAGEFTVDQAFLNKAAAAPVPIVNVPTS